MFSRSIECRLCISDSDSATSRQSDSINISDISKNNKMSQITKGAAPAGFGGVLGCFTGLARLIGSFALRPCPDCAPFPLSFTTAAASCLSGFHSHIN